MIKKTPKQLATIVEKTITEIRKQQQPIIEKKQIIEQLKEEVKFFNDVTFNEIIKQICLKNEINEKHIRTVAGWNNN